MNLPAKHNRFIYALFFLSGFCALVYELLWAKHLALAFGTTMPAVSIVAATFMGGLALGSYIIGRHADSNQNQLRLYAYLEAAIAIFALLFPPTLSYVNQLHIYLERTLPGHPLFIHGSHFLGAVILLLPPAVCMGGTFPLMCRFFARKKSGGQIGRLYAYNTFGATAGTLCAGFLLIPSLGLAWTNYIAAGLNLLIALAALIFARRITSMPTTAAQQVPDGPPLQPGQHVAVLFAVGLIGAFALCYEILWTRVFLLFLGNTTYAFSLILGAFLIGIAVGGAIYARKVHPKLNEYQVLAQLTLLMGASVLCTAPFYDHLADLFLWAHSASRNNWWLLSLLSFCIALAVMALPTLLSGSLLPAASAILQTGRTHTGRSVGLIVLCNTIGGMLGSLIGGFWLVPSLGLENSLRLVAGLNLLLGCWLFWHFRSTVKLTVPIRWLAGCALLLALVLPNWDQKLINSGVYCYAQTYAKHGGIRHLTGPERILTVIEGQETTVAVKEIDTPKPTRYFSVNGKTDGGNGADMHTQILIGQLPLLLHPNPQTALVIGLGTGITLGSTTATPLTRIDCAEISPEVVAASRYFERENHMALTDPRVALHIEDGRELLQVREGLYDVIISQPSNPWQAGNANLFTREFYELAARRLAKNGIFSQWLGLYDITPDNLKVACRTLLDVFPYTLTFKSGSDLMVLASNAPLLLDYRNLSMHLESSALAPVIAPLGLTSVGDLLARHYYFNDTTLREFAAGDELNTDMRPVLEFTFQHTIGGKMFSQLKNDNLKVLNAMAAGQTAPLTNLGTTESDIATALRDLSNSYMRVDKGREARYYHEQLINYENAVMERPANRTLGG